MKITSVILGLCCVTVMSCGDDKSTTIETETVATTDQNARITAKTIESLNYNDYVLSSEAEKAIISWDKYRELESQIRFLKKADFSFFNGDKELLTTFIREFKTQMPEEFKTNPIISRNAIIETALLKLNENLTIDNIERKDKLLGIKALFVAFSNLNYQINKKLEKDTYNKIQPE